MTVKQKPKDGWKSPRDSDKVVTILFKRDQTWRTFYSWDWKGKFGAYQCTDGSINDYGLNGLRARVINKHLHASSRLFVSKNDSQDPKKRTLLEYYEDGIRQELTPQLLTRLQT